MLMQDEYEKQRRIQENQGCRQRMVRKVSRLRVQKTKKTRNPGKSVQKSSPGGAPKHQTQDEEEKFTGNSQEILGKPPGYSQRIQDRSANQTANPLVNEALRNKQQRKKTYNAKNKKEKKKREQKKKINHHKNKKILRTTSNNRQANNKIEVQNRL